MVRSGNLHRAKAVKDDEFYTCIEDIDKELLRYMEYFKGKTVYCNCDDFYASNFVRYFILSFKKFGLNKLYVSGFLGNSMFRYEPSLFSDMCVHQPILYCITNTEVIENKENIGSEEIRLLLSDKRNTQVHLKGDEKYPAGDFRSNECVCVLRDSDIVVTNPPFSLLREYVALLFSYEKSFLFIGSLNAVTCKEIFPLLCNGKIWFGYHDVKGFYNGDGSYHKFGNIGWYTNLPVQHKSDTFCFTERYYSRGGGPLPGINEKYPKYDNYDAINVDKLKDIPLDYDGVMGVPITFLRKYNPVNSEFEILGFSGRWDNVSFRNTYYKNALFHKSDGTIVDGSKLNTRATILIGKLTDGTAYYTADNQPNPLRCCYARVFIKRKTKN